LNVGYIGAGAANFNAGLVDADGDTIVDCRDKPTPSAIQLGEPGTEQQILEGLGFGFTQVVPADCNCATVTYHIQRCALSHCERYVLTIAKVDQCGTGLCGTGANGLGTFSIHPITNVALDTVQGQDLCGRNSATFSALVGVETVVVGLEAGDLIACYLTILEPVNACKEKCIPCVAEVKEDTKKTFPGPGGVLVSINLS
jgi:hypothetical protein